MTPQLMQSIKLLQMSAMELSSFVQGEIEKNPLLEIGQTTGEFAEERRGQTDVKGNEGEQQNNQPHELDGKTSEWEPKSVDGNAKQSEQLAQFGQNSGNTTASGIEFSGNVNDLEAYVPIQQCLREFLLQQAALTFRSSDKFKIAQEIIDLIDTDGYLRNDLDSLCKQFATDMPTILGVLDEIQQFDPPGVGARNLAECMRLQLAEKNRLDPAMRIFTDNLELLARRDYSSLERLCGVNHEDLIEMAREIQALEPRPGDAFEPVRVQNVVADVFVNSKNDGSWQIELNTHTLPKVLINREYYAEIKNLGQTKADKKIHD